MKIFLTYVGKAKNREYSAIANDYLKRSNGLCKINGVNSVEEIVFADSKEKNIKARQKDVTKRILAKLSANDGRIILMDHRGRELSSVGLSKKIANWVLDSDRDLYFVIAGAEGFDKTMLNKADFVLSLSKMTWPHELAKLMLSEQIYRAFCILNNHPYHQEN